MRVTVKPQVSKKVEDQKEETEGFEPRTHRYTKRVCSFCTSRVEPRYWDVSSLRRYINDRGRIVPRGRSGMCAKHQRRAASEIKHARILSLLPFVVRT